MSSENIFIKVYNLFTYLLYQRTALFAPIVIFRANVQNEKHNKNARSYKRERQRILSGGYAQNFPRHREVDFGNVRRLCLRTNFARLRLEISPQSLLSLSVSFFICVRLIYINTRFSSKIQPHCYRIVL